MNSWFGHLLSLSDDVGTFEHAEYRSPRLEHGYCTDDVARVLLAVCGEERRTARMRDLERRSLRFVIEAQDQSGLTVNRRRADGRWAGTATTDDCWGRSLWALGVATVAASTPSTRSFARSAFELCCQNTSTSPRALAFATFGAERFLSVADSVGALWCVRQFADWFEETDTANMRADWPWPESRLSYANAALCEALLVAGYLLDRLPLVHRGLELLEWLVDHDSRNGHLSPTPVGGAGPGDPVGRFDQQPIEVAAFATAARRAFEATFDRRWLDVIDTCGRWFDGDNDSGLVMWNPQTGAGFDGLQRADVNRNCGAESTLAAITTMQQRAAVTQLL